MYHEANFCVDDLTSLGCSNDFDLVIYNQPLVQINSFLFADSVGILHLCSVVLYSLFWACPLFISKKSLYNRMKKMLYAWWFKANKCPQRICISVIVLKYSTITLCIFWIDQPLK